jgi:hypothetical protein
MQPWNLPADPLKSSNPYWCACGLRPAKEELTTDELDMDIRRFMFLLLAIANLALLRGLARAQALVDSGDSSSSTVNLHVSATPPQPDLTYIPPPQRAELQNYLFDAFGPYPIVGAAIAGGINQMQNTPPEWRQGAEGYGKRFGSDFGIAAVTTTTRYALSEALHEDTLYYRCECKGVFRRVRHAAVSTFTARRGDDGHRVFSFPDLVAPYAGTMTAVYGWYPGRYGYKDAFRMGNYSLLGYVGANIGLEFLSSGPHSWISRMHLNNAHGAPDSGSNP